MWFVELMDAGHRLLDWTLITEVGYPRQNGLDAGLRELGRIERTLPTLKWLQDPMLRRRVSAARNSLARVVFWLSYERSRISPRRQKNRCVSRLPSTHCCCRMAATARSKYTVFHKVIAATSVRRHRVAPRTERLPLESKFLDLPNV
ncbi:hypothetical protein A8F72_24830 [Burkholderia cenocepacia]|nr:hypothetical protein A8F32_19310 [Burkholderia cenocepacia]ONJ04255.1 hypothetical protein A8F33_24185 [Burkholderia cenocepacia]ONJ09475.1 hypothetical protein A8F53_00405 [Burkholderia cenocepacia]ONJ29366.1 hypothetical protein A8F38_18010 [Burkholderia cenocepacia]ONY61185.1 hypothetical protein A8F35_35655 [Burkholderia cenocepacia]